MEVVVREGMEAVTEAGIQVEAMEEVTEAAGMVAGMEAVGMVAEATEAGMEEVTNESRLSKISETDTQKLVAIRAIKAATVGIPDRK